MLVSIVGVDRIVSAATIVIGEPGDDSGASVVVAVVIAEVVVAVAGADEEGVGQQRQVDRDRGGVREALLGVDRLREINGSEQQTAAGDGVVPVAVHEAVAARSPAVLCGNPHEIVLGRDPVAGSPGVACLLPGPDAGDPHLIRFGGLGGGAGFEAVRRFGEILFGEIRRGAETVRLDCDLGFETSPVTGDPLKAFPFGGLSPVAGDPFSSFGDITVETADPEEVGAFIVPSPVAGDPGDIGPGRRLVGRNFFNGLGGLPGNHDAGRRVGDDRSGEGFVDRSATHHFDAVLIRLKLRLSRGSARFAKGCVWFGEGRRFKRQRDEESRESGDQECERKGRFSGHGTPRLHW